MNRLARFGALLTLGIALSVPTAALAQIPGHGSMPGMPAEKAPAGPAASSHESMETPDPMETPIPDAGVPKATATRGGEPLAFKLADGIKVFELTAKPVKWRIVPEVKGLPEVWATTWSYNGQIPGPMIRVTEGDRIRVILKNELPVPTGIHWHGLRVPNAMDGIADPALTQQPVQPGESFTYEFTVRDVGTFFYHSHVDTDRQIPAGLAGAFIADPKAAGRARTWTTRSCYRSGG